ncbi:MAG: prolipoprotein diacylglyceryl transferase family protein [Bacteroidota bacterium]
MYPDLSYVFHDLFGTTPDNWLSIFKTFGLLVALAVLSAAYLLRLELKRRADIGQFSGSKAKVISNAPFTVQDYVLNGLFGFIVGFKLLYVTQHLAEMQADPSAVVLSTKGNWLGGILGAGLLTAYYYYIDHGRKSDGPEEVIKDIFPHDRIMDISTVAVISGVIGAKLFTVIEQPEAFFADPMGQLLSGDGWTIYGGLIGGFIGTYIYLRRKNIEILPVLDAVAPALIVSYGVGRMGCHFSGDGDWGIPAGPQPDWWFLPDWLWAQDYPRNVLNRGVEMAECVGRYCSHLPDPVYPTSVYETTMAFTIGLILWSLRKRVTPWPGLLFAIYLIFNGIERYFIEGIRVNDRHEVLGGFTQAEFIALILTAIGVVWTLWLLLGKKNKANGETAKYSD